MAVNNDKKIIVILGPTACGKTGLAVKLAHKLNSEIVSADSRQVYKGMDVGTGKDLSEYRIKLKNGKMKKIPYHLIDVVGPKTEFSLAKYQKLAFKSIDDILKRGRVPILAGGSGLYLEAVVDGFILSKQKKDNNLRNELEKLNTRQLLKKLEQKDKNKFLSLNNSDKNNKRRLIRYIEIATGGGVIGKKTARYNSLLLGVSYPREVIKKRIYKRLIERLEKEDMIGEVGRLRRGGVSWKRLEGFGLEYKFISFYLRGKMNYDDMVNSLFIAICQFAKKQESWFRRWEKGGAKINWISSSVEANNLVRQFIK